MIDYQRLSDNALADLLRESDRKAFAEIFERYSGLLLHHAFRMTRDREQAEDCVQDVFQVLWEKSSEIEIHTSLAAFLYTAIRFRVLKTIRHSKVADSYLSTLQNELDSGVATTDLAIEEKELAKKIESGLSKLPPKMREVFELSRLHDYSYRQISDKLAISDNTVKRQISNALKIMRESLKLIF